MSRFNLIDEKWFPVRFPNGTRDKLGIRDTLLRSKEIAAIEDPSPLVVGALHRLLLAVLYRALEGPTDIGHAKTLFREGLPSEKIISYLEKWRERFWLFDDEHPFYQVPEYEPKIEHGIQRWRSWTAIATEHNADNAKVLFDHTAINTAEPITAGKATRWLLAIQTFAVGGGNSDFRYTRSAPSATAVMALPLGVDLHDTLLLSLVPQNKEIMTLDKPIWEQNPTPVTSLRQGIGRAPLGYADLYTWLTRAVKFRFAGNENTVQNLVIASGVNCEINDYVDPMLAYEVDEKKGKLAVRFRERGFWRDFDSLLPDNSNLSPKVIDHATELTKSSQDRFRRSVIVLGQANDQAKIEFWRLERFVLPDALRGDRDVRTEIRQLLSEANAAQNVLWKACNSFARDILCRGDRHPGMSSIKEFIRQMPVNSLYWSTLESRFQEILSEYTLERDSDEIRCRWLKFVRDALMAAWEQHSTAVATGDAWAIRALVRAGAPVRQKLKELNDEIRKYEGLEVSA